MPGWPQDYNLTTITLSNCHYLSRCRIIPGLSVWTWDRSLIWQMLFRRWSSIDPCRARYTPHTMLLGDLASFVVRLTLLCYTNRGKYPETCYLISEHSRCEIPGEPVSYCSNFLPTHEGHCRAEMIPSPGVIVPCVIRIFWINPAVATNVNLELSMDE